MAIEPEREQFPKLIVQNPNYFGNISGSVLKPVKPMTSNKTYEELTCIGYNPETDTLEGTIQIKRDTGYAGDLCHAGSQEFVRFFLNYGSGWEDLGAVALNVHDIPTEPDCAKHPGKPLSYDVSLKLDPKRDRCSHPLLPRVRGILSWHWMPPAGVANVGWLPPWGNMLEVDIQIRPRRLILKDVAGPLAAEHAGLAEHELPEPEVAPLAVAELAKLYGGQGKQAVPAHRFGMQEIDSVLASSAQHHEVVAAKMAEWKKIGLDWAAVVADLQKVQADVSFEELTCLGLEHTGPAERLVATFHTKRPTGFNGTLCQHGSTEYVAFWADWDDTCQWTYLGTATVAVHDFPIGLAYAAILPVDLTAHRRPCDKPKIGRVRAVLSWNAPPSTTNPDALAHWGNRLDSHVQIKPGPVVDPHHPHPIMGVLGGIPISKIDNGTGLTTPDAFFALNGLAPDGLGRPCPFGGRVVLQGPAFVGYKYRVSVHKVGDPGPPTYVTTTLRLVDWTGTVVTQQVANANHFFTFVDPMLNIDAVLAWWDTTGDDAWIMTLELATLAETSLGSVSHRIQLDNTAPVTEIHIDNGGDCLTYTQNQTLNGHFVARDANFGSYSLGVSPFPGPVVPASGTVQTTTSPGDAWSLDTTTLKPCGYVIVVSAVDRAIVNSASVGHWSSAAAGFCVKAPGT